MRRLALLALFALPLAACDTPGPLVNTDDALDVDTVDFDAVTALDFERYVRPILAQREVVGDLRETTYEAVLAAGPSGTVVPFDGDASLMVRLAEETLAPGSEDPLPGLRSLQPDEVRYLRRWIEAGARRTPEAPPAYADAEALLYVCNQFAGRVQVVDVDRQRVVRNVYFEALGQPADAKPHHVIAEPDGSAWYVALISGDGGGSVLKLSASLAMDPGAADYLLAQEAPPSGEATFQKPGMLAYDATGGRLFAGRSFSADPTSSGIGRFNAATLAFETLATPDVHPHALETSRDGRYVFTAALTSQGGATDAYVLDAASGDLVDRERVPGALAFVQYAVSPDGETVVLTSQTGGALYVFDFDTASGDLALRGNVPTGEQPWHPVFSPDGARVYVPNRLSNTVSIVDPAALAVTGTFAGGLPFSQPHGSALSADGGVLFISSRNFNMPMMNMAPEASGGMDHGGIDHSEMDHEGMDHSGMDGMAGDGAMGGMAMAAIDYTPAIRFLMPDGTPEPEDLYANVAMIDAASGALLGTVQTGRWASGLALYDPR